MRTIRKTTFAAAGAIAALTLTVSVQAQDDEPPNIVSIEIFGCTYNEGNDLGDLMGVVDNWNDWADENGVDNYNANVLTPYFFSPAFPYDVLWLGVYPSEEDFGAGAARWLADGQDMNAEFGEVVTCSTHGLYAATAMHVPAGPPPGDDGMVNLQSFQDCTLINESNVFEAFAAHGEWGDFLAENGADVFMGALFPVAGEDPSAEYDYKAVTNYSSAIAYGEALSAAIPGGLQRAGQLFSRVVECDTPRIYTTTQVRSANQD